MASQQRISRIQNPKYERSGLKSYVHLMNKYKFQPTQPGPYFLNRAVSYGGRCPKLNRLLRRKRVVNHTVMRMLDNGQKGTVSAADQQNDSEYLCPVTIGTPGKTFSLDFDTGSADLWIFSSELPANEQSSGGVKHTIFDASQSSTYQATNGATWNISYGDGSSASGDVGTDTVTIGGLAITNQTIELAKQLSAEFASGSGDGLLGLAFDTINTVQPTAAKTPMDNLIAQNTDSAGFFTAYLASWRDTAAADKGASFYTFGCLDEAVMAAAGATAPDYTPVDSSQGFWMFPSASAAVNGTQIARTGNTAIADTGTTLALVDDNTCTAIYKAIPGATYDNTQQGWVFPTSVTPAQLPTVAFAVGDKQYTIPKEALAFAETGNGTWYGGVQSRGSMTFDILGDTFLKGIYAVFDVKQTRFGAVQRKDETGDTLVPTPTNSQKK